MNIIEYVVVQNQKENSKYKVIEDIVLPKAKRHWLELENTKTGEHKEVKLFWYAGRKTYLISEDILQDIYLSNRYLYAKLHGSVLAIEDKYF